MAKKVRRAPEDEAPAYEFPTFDETTFLTKEFELGTALALVASLALIAGILSWAATTEGLWWWIVFPAGVVWVAASYWVVSRLRPKADLYTKGDWAGLIALEFFAWIAVWFVLRNVT